MENSGLFKKKKRNYGIDLLRSIAIFMVIILHVLKKSNALDTFQAGTLQHGIIWGTEAFAICAVNIFAIISGFVCSEQKFKAKRVISLWLEVLFYSVSSYLITAAIFHDFSYNELISSFLPIVTKKYWYVSAYSMIMLLMPMFNCFIERAEKGEFKAFLIVFGVYFSFIHMKFDVVQIIGGFSWIWLSYLYFVGAYLKKYDLPKMSKKSLTLIYVAASFMILFLYVFIECLTERILGKTVFADNIYFYNCPLVLLQALALFQLFREIEIKGKSVVFIQYLSSLSFGVYLVHGTFLRYFEKFLVICDSPAYMFIPLTLLYASAIYIVSCIAEILRRKIFKILHIDAVSKNR